MANGEAAGQGDPGDVMLLVCITCGREYQFDGGRAPESDLECEKCGGAVFRRFDDTSSPSEAQTEFRDETERDLATTDPEGDATRGDLHDLNP